MTKRARADSRDNEQARKAELAELLTEFLGEALTEVSRSKKEKVSDSGTQYQPQRQPDQLDEIRRSQPWPPRYFGGGHRDGSVVPHRLSVATWLQGLPWLFEPFLHANGASEVPDEFWSRDEVDGAPVAIVSCPCGGTPMVREATFRFCESDNCKRVFLNMGGAIRVAHMSDEQMAALEDPIDS